MNRSDFLALLPTVTILLSIPLMYMCVYIALLNPQEIVSVSLPAWEGLT